MLCDDLEGWDGGPWGESEAQGGGDICVLKADPHYCTAESSTTLWSSYPPMKNKFQKKKCELFSSVQFSSVAQSCPTLCDPMNRSTPGLPVHHPLPEFTQTHV